MGLYWSPRMESCLVQLVVGPTRGRAGTGATYRALWRRGLIRPRRTKRTFVWVPTPYGCAFIAQKFGALSK